MGCFLGCFGGSKDRKRRKQRNKVIPRDQQHRHGGQNSLQGTVSTTELPIKEPPPTNLVSTELRDNPEEKLSPLSSSNRKRVTFNSNVTTYENVSVIEGTEFFPEGKEVIEKEKGDILVQSSKSESEDDSITSSIGSYPRNHRYQNCRDSDDEAETFGDSDLEDDGEDGEDYSDYDEDGNDQIFGLEVQSGSGLTATVESRTDDVSDRLTLGEVESPMKASFLPEQEVKTLGLNRNARSRSAYVHPVLNPVENLTQWKTVKSRGTSQWKPQKENFSAELEVPRMSFSSQPTFKQPSSGLKQKSDSFNTLSQDIAVDASLSTWLVGRESTPAKTSLSSLETVTCEKVSSTSPGSNSVRSFEDRPILGALTVEELKQLSAASSPRRSPSWSPDEMPIIGTVGTYWNDSVSSKDSRSASSYKGIPNTTSKYREDKRINWHNTPFETRLERALNRGAGEA
ncbi:unnamed protein product [Coffea canephora]|uniref:Protein JASON n=1 Tax=Coffea canephora TaxID=49390 RepID=A0A068U5N1_COFCA|nr:unnamed protein product [Coffea canephora]